MVSFVPKLSTPDNPDLFNIPEGKYINNPPLNDSDILNAGLPLLHTRLNTFRETNKVCKRALMNLLNKK